MLEHLAQDMFRIKCSAFIFLKSVCSSVSLHTISLLCTEWKLYVKLFSHKAWASRSVCVGIQSTEGSFLYWAWSDPIPVDFLGRSIYSQNPPECLGNQWFSAMLNAVHQPWSLWPARWKGTPYLMSWRGGKLFSVKNLSKSENFFIFQTERTCNAFSVAIIDSLSTTFLRFTKEIFIQIK